MISEKTWRLEAVGQLFLSVLGTLGIGMLLATLLQTFPAGLSQDMRRFLGMCIMTLCFQIAALVWIAIFLKGENLSWSRAFGFSTPRPARTIALAITVVLIVLPLTWGLQQLSIVLMNWVHIKPEAQAVVEELQNPSLSLVQKIYFGILAIVVAPMAEETLFRGILYPTIKQLGYPRLALWGTSIFFSATHLSISTFLPLVFLAIILTFLYEETDNLLAPVVAHSVFNAINFFVLMFIDPISRLLNLK